MSIEGEPALPRIRTLPSHLADQIAAGEVVERPASVVRELVDNALDAGARRIEIHVQGGGAERIAIVDDGHGIHPEDLELAVTRHATSKIRRAADLADVATLGFRGEALASIAAVARVRIESRRRGAGMGHALEVGPSRPPRLSPVGMPAGTRIEITDLFATLPARRKFLRSEATELGHVTETVLRAALVHPSVYFVVRTPGRTLLELVACGEDARIEAVLARRGRGLLRHVTGEHGGTRVDAWMLVGEGVARAGQGLFVIVRRRVVRERHLARILAEHCHAEHEVGAGHPAGPHPIACLCVEPGEGIVDVNVHPQKAEIRFADAQKVYADVRAVLERQRPAVASVPSASIGPRPTALGDVVARWAARAEPAAASRGGAAAPVAPYRLRTHAVGGGYVAHREELRAGAGALDRARRTADPSPLPEPASEPARDDGPLYLGCLPGHVGLFRAGDDLLAVDLRALRSHLLLLRLGEDLGGAGVLAQALLQPAVVPLPAEDVARVQAGATELSRLGIVVDAFGDGAVIVRAVPATLRGCVDDPDAADLLARVLPWLRTRPVADVPLAHGDAAELGPVAAAIARTAGPDPAPRLARRWLAELALRGEPLERVPGVRRYTAAQLVGGDPSESDGRA